MQYLILTLLLFVGIGLILIATSKRDHYSYYMGRKVVSIWIETVRWFPGVFEKLTKVVEGDISEARLFMVVKYKCTISIGKSMINIAIPKALYMEMRSRQLPTALQYVVPDNEAGKKQDPHSSSHV